MTPHPQTRIQEHLPVRRQKKTFACQIGFDDLGETVIGYGPLQILASALPGFRDLRAPVITGYLWLTFAWLIVQPNLDAKPSGDLAAAAYDLGQDIGHIGIVVAAGVAAYLIGSVSQSASQIVAKSASQWFYRNFEDDSALRMQPVRERAIKQLLAAHDEGVINADQLESLEEILQRQTKDASQEADRELERPAVLLVGKQPELFADVDRTRAEGELRVSVAIPLLALAGLLAACGSLWWLAALPAIIALFAQGLDREVDSKKKISEAIQIGRIESSSTEKFAEWVDQIFPELIASMGKGDASLGEML